MRSIWIQGLAWTGMISFAACNPEHKLAELRDPGLQIDITLGTSTRIFDLFIPNSGVASDSCPRTVESFKGFVNDVELDCAAGQQLDQRAYGGFLVCAAPRCYLREGAIPNDQRSIPRSPTTVVRAYDSSASFELNTVDVLGAQDVALSFTGNEIKTNTPIQLQWRGPAVGRVVGGTVSFVDENGRSAWSQPLDIATGTVIDGASIRFNFPATPPMQGTLLLVGTKISAPINACNGAARCGARVTHGQTFRIPVTVAP